MSEYILIRNVTKKECNWLGKGFKKGQKVFSYSGITYGCISNSGKAFTLTPDETPFFELPINAVKKTTP